MQITLSITVTGKVQGVYYRQGAREKALELGLTGEVKNLRDGNVHIIATGTLEQLDAFTEWCKKGPPRAVVAGAEIIKIPLKLFERLYVFNVFVNREIISFLKSSQVFQHILCHCRQVKLFFPSPIFSCN
jgi:acylphosphatase